MRMPVKTMLAGGGGLLCLLALAPWDSTPKGNGRLWVGERVLWKRIHHSEPLPVPFRVSKAGSEGVMVCSLFIDEEGKVTDVSVIQTPHPALVESLQSSFQSWSFSKTTIRGYPVKLTGKVIMYLVNDNGAGRFLTAVEMIERNRSRAFALEAKRDVQLVDVRVRGEFKLDPTPQAVNIPLDELQVRAPVELSLDKLVAIDCSRLFQARCKTAANYLKGEGFDQVAIVGQGRAQCPECE